MKDSTKAELPERFTDDDAAKLARAMALGATRVTTAHPAWVNHFTPIAAELVRRWNQYPELLERIAVLEDAQKECK